MQTERLTTIAALKEWLGIPSDQAANNDQLVRLIDAASRFTLNWLNRESFQVRTYTYNFRGMGKPAAILQNWPVQAVTSVGVGGSFVPASTIGQAGLPSSGYVLSDARFGPQSLELYGYGFYSGAPSQIIYTAGFRASETATIPADPHELTPTEGGQWTLNIGVEIDGTEAVEVESAPTAGQYSVDEWGTYTFALADVGKTAVMTYDYAPWDVSFAVTELIGEWYKRKDRIGLISKTLGGQETVTFSQKDMGDSIRSSLQPYANVVPMYWPARSSSLSRSSGSEPLPEILTKCPTLFGLSCWIR